MNQYYPPDAAPTGVMLRAVVEELAAQGHAVTVICAEGGYAGGERRTSNAEHRTSNGDVGRMGPSTPTILRIRATRFGRGTFVGKVVDYLSYYVGVAWKLMFLQPRPERIVALTTPPYLSVLARICSKLRGGDHAHWVMDLYPDVMVAHGMLREGGGAHRLLAGLARWGFGGKRRAALLTLGPDMAERIVDLIGTDSSMGPGCRQRGGTKMARDPAFAGRPATDEVGHLRKGAPTGDDVGRARPADPIWIPLWSGEGGEHGTSNVEHGTSNVEHGTSDVEHGTSKGEEELGMAVANRRRERGWREDELVVMYSGNMGLGHRFGEILEVIGRDGFTHPSHLSPAARGENEKADECRGEGREEDPANAGRPAADKVGRMRKSNPTGDEVGRMGKSNPTGDEVGRLREADSIRFVFFGGGKRRGEIERLVAEHPEAAVELHDYAPAEDLGIHLRSADVHLASLAAEWTGTMVPSKLQGIFHAARPVIFIGDVKSSIGRWVSASGGGWVVAPGDVAGLERALDEARDPAVRGLRGRAAKVFAEANFDRTHNVRQVAEVLL